MSLSHINFDINRIKIDKLMVKQKSKNAYNKFVSAFRFNSFMFDPFF